jgi:hypothetical protein
LPASVVVKLFTLFPRFPVRPQPGESLRQRVETIRLMRTVRQCVGGVVTVDKYLMISSLLLWALVKIGKAAEILGVEVQTLRALGEVRRTDPGSAQQRWRSLL